MTTLQSLKAAKKSALENVHTTQAALSADNSPAAFAARWAASAAYSAASTAYRVAKRAAE